MEQVIAIYLMFGFGLAVCGRVVVKEKVPLAFYLLMMVGWPLALMSTVWYLLRKIEI